MNDKNDASWKQPVDQLGAPINVTEEDVRAEGHRQIEESEITPDVQLFIKRVTSVGKKLPKQMEMDDKTRLELAHMNRQQRRAFLSNARKETK